MKQNSVVAISKHLHVTRTRVYQIIRQLEKQGKIKKDADGKYILDNQAVNEITDVYKSNSKAFTVAQKLSKAEKKIQSLNNQVKELQDKQAGVDKLINEYQKRLKLQEDYIQSLKDSKKNAEQFTQVMNKALDSLNKEQGLNYIDKVKKLPQDEKKQPVVADNDEEKHVSAWQKIKNKITGKN